MTADRRSEVYLATAAGIVEQFREAMNESLDREAFLLGANCMLAVTSLANQKYEDDPEFLAEFYVMVSRCMQVLCTEQELSGPPDPTSSD